MTRRLETPRLAVPIDRERHATWYAKFFLHRSGSSKPTDKRHGRLSDADCWSRIASTSLYYYRQVSVQVQTVHHIFNNFNCNFILIRYRYKAR